ncbi:uncharacterized protein LOC6575556 [Drosophila mojavensis]|uniref:CHK kinase-like domain-containing protein n=1 Tax=Drosophila mojavensis TaxID=7230 RepID=B4KFP2_DROMO|nr:uncharacterized protein LOC6575556 [Drosophila mojavensis]EDW11007.1 uncharacterized protein Dmoj_GI16158 [Drosophila mojavensis]
MGEVPQIKDLHKVIEVFLQGDKLESYESRYLTKPGDNYGSLMLAISAKLRQSNDVLKDMQLIAKLPPLTNDLYWQIFQPERTCITENAVYKYLAPEIEKLQLESGVLPVNLFDGFPRYFGSRISLCPEANKVDRDAVLVQENLTIRGFQPGNRHKPYDLQHTVLILHYMAQFHALPIALRLKKPTVFESKIRPYFKKFDMNKNMEADTKDMLKDESIRDIEDIADGDMTIINGVKKLQDLFNEFETGDDVNDGPWTSIVHMDLWINNLMVKYDETGLPVKLKIVDFQIAQYESVIHDLIFLLLSSVDTPVLEENYYNFLRIYYEAFIQALQKANVNTREYNYEAYLQEVQRVAPLQVPHALIMTKVILADNNTLPSDYKDVDLTMITKKGSEKVMNKLRDIIRLARKFNIFE